LHASVLLKSDFPYKTVGIENHVNYIHKSNGNLSVHEAFGIAAVLNTSVIDTFFRALNGNTQVNATDIRSLPFPQIEDIRKIGELVYESKFYRNGFDLDNIVTRTLGINVEVIKNLN
jgi:adenine-specific DNA-methyltransferase